MSAYLFPIGQLVATPGLLSLVGKVEMMNALDRHMKGDWGTVNKEDKEANNQALKDGARLLSAYLSKDGIKFWIITEADRSVTTILLPSEY
jgi:hypothetical protein